MPTSRLMCFGRQACGLFASLAACAPDAAPALTTPFPMDSSAPQARPSLLEQDVQDVGRSTFVDHHDIGIGRVDVFSPAADTPLLRDHPVDENTSPFPEQHCRLPSSTYDAAMQELDVGAGSTTRLRFTVPGVPPGFTVATLHFDSHDADHPMQEGRIYINQRGGLDLPAHTAWDNVTITDNAVDVTPFVVPGSNLVEFAAGPLSRSFFRIGRVRFDVTVRSAIPCGTPPPPPPPPPDTRPVERRLTYQQATWVNRHNVVFRCDAHYAYTARGSDHIPTDCERRYAPDGTLRARATWTFTHVIPGTYDVLITSRHSSNRNAAMALFLVNGEPRRIDQRTGAGSLTLETDTWGRRALSGTVTVVLDSFDNRGSDSVSAVILRPAR